MSTSSADENPRPLLGIYAPDLSGFNFGELIGQLLTLCRMKNYRVVVIKTGNFGVFKSQIHSDEMDMIIVLRNAIHPELAKILLDKGKSIVSISYDYFPLNIPLVANDNNQGVELAISHLMEKGHKKFLFVGNLTNFDVRKRYEAFCDQLEEHNLETWEEEVFQVEDDLIGGGYEAADRYFKSACNATAIICGTAMNSIGFSRRLDNHNPNLKGLISVVAFDAISLIPVLDPDITTVDQNQHLLAYKALSIIENKEDLDRNKHHHIIAPKLITRDSEFMRSEDAYLATSCELMELYNPNYIKSLLCSVGEWSKSIAAKKLDNIMILRTLFSRYLSAASISRALKGQGGRSRLVYTKIITIREVLHADVKDPENVSSEEQFPKTYQDFNPSDYDTCIHVPRFTGERIWGFVSVYGKQENRERPCSYTGFVAFLDHIVEWMSLEGYDKSASGELEGVHLEQELCEGLIIWNKETNEVEWDNEALKIIGFVSELEQKIYRNMELYDRLDADFVGSLREYLLGGNSATLPVQVKFKNKAREYVLCDLRLDGEDDENNIRIKISLSVAGG